MLNTASGEMVWQKGHQSVPSLMPDIDGDKVRDFIFFRAGDRQPNFLSGRTGKPILNFLDPPITSKVDGARMTRGLTPSQRGETGEETETRHQIEISHGLLFWNGTRRSSLYPYESGVTDLYDARTGKYFTSHWGAIPGGPQRRWPHGFVSPLGDRFDGPIFSTVCRCDLRLRVGRLWAEKTIWATQQLGGGKDAVVDINTKKPLILDPGLMLKSSLPAETQYEAALLANLDVLSLLRGRYGQAALEEQECFRRKLVRLAGRSEAAPLR